MARYHPLYDGLWNDDKLEGAPFEEKGFFAFVFANHRQRPSGIYRMTDVQAAADTGLPVRKVHEYFAHLAERRLIVRDGAWIFVRGYFKRQPKGQNLLKGVESDVRECTSACVLRSFGERYPLLSRWSADGLATVGHPIIGIVPAEQLQLQSSTEQSSTEQGDPGNGRPTVGPSALPAPRTRIEFQIPASILTALGKCPALGAAKKLHDPAWWQAELRANPGVDFAAQVYNAEAYMRSHPEKHYKRLEVFLHGWLGRTEREAD